MYSITYLVFPKSGTINDFLGSVTITLDSYNDHLNYCREIQNNIDCEIQMTECGGDESWIFLN